MDSIFRATTNRFMIYPVYRQCRINFFFFLAKDASYGDEDGGADGGVGVDENEVEESYDEDPDVIEDETVFSDVDW